MYLPDPRQFPRVAPKNPLIRQVMRVMTARESDERSAAGSELHQLLTTALENNDDAGLEEALALSPSQEAYKYLFGELREILEAAPETGERAMIFAVPVLIVAAATKGQVQIAGRLNDIQAITDTLKQNGVFADSADVSLSPVLASLATLQGIKPSQLWRWSQNLKDAARGVPMTLPEAPIVASTEAVHLRFLVGVAIQRAGQPAPVRMSGDASKWGMLLSKQISEQLKVENGSVLAIPRGPQPLLQAMHSARFARLETGLQLFASTVIRTLRQGEQEPVAVIAAHENHELRFTVSSPTNAERWQGYVWPLHPLDSVELIHDNARQLFNECRLDDVRIVREIQPDRRNDIPLFLIAQDKEAAAE